MEQKTRLDVYLVQTGLATGREKAKEYINAGAVTVNGKPVIKPSFLLTERDAVCCQTEEIAYVGRGGKKLEKALAVAGISPSGLTAMDVGASTGGFTHCLLLGGAVKVYAVDVGHGQLHASLIADPRVVNLEGTDIRSDALKQHIPVKSVDLLTMDVSFVSLRTVLPAVFSYLRENAWLFLLIKPQFEAGKSDVGKNGIVRDKRVHCRVLREMCSLFSDSNCTLQYLTFSPITGGAGRNDGNIEYLAILRYQSSDTTTGEQTVDIRALVEQAFDTFKNRVTRI